MKSKENFMQNNYSSNMVLEHIAIVGIVTLIVCIGMALNLVLA